MEFIFKLVKKEFRRILILFFYKGRLFLIVWELGDSSIKQGTMLICRHFDHLCTRSETVCSGHKLTGAIGSLVSLGSQSVYADQPFNSRLGEGVVLDSLNLWLWGKLTDASIIL